MLPVENAYYKSFHIQETLGCKSSKTTEIYIKDSKRIEDGYTSVGGPPPISHSVCLKQNTQG